MGNWLGTIYPHSIRWRLPFSYAGIALLAAVALGGVLLFTLQQHYNQLEREYLDASAASVAHSAERLYQDRDTLSDDVFQSSANIYAFLVKARVRLLNADRQIIADSGTLSDQDLISVDVRRPGFAAEGAKPEPAGAGFETYLSIQPGMGGLEGQPLVGLEDTPPYRFRFAPDAVDRLLAGFISGGSRTDLSVTLPLFGADNELLGYLELSESPAFGADIIKDVAERAIVAGIVAVLLAALAGWVASRQISRPVLALAETTQQMAEGDLSVRVELKRCDEFGLLARTFNAMAERVENTVLTLQRFVADAAHEINTPITALHTNLELAASGGRFDDFRADIARAQVELARLETLARELLTLSRLEARSPERIRASVDLVALARQVVENHASRAEQGEIALALHTPDAPLIIQANERQIARMVDNLLDNALKFTPAGGTVTLEVRALPGGVELSIVDTGIGIPAEDLPKLFGRFHRGRNVGAYPGHGLGLAISQAIVEDHGGRITVESDGTGTQVVVRLPGDANTERRRAL